MPTNFAPGGKATYLAVAANVGGGETAGQAVTMKVSLPPSTSSYSVTGFLSDPSAVEPPQCTEEALTATVTCTTTEDIHPGRLIAALVQVEVESGAVAGTEEAKASVSG
ncbi:MAG: hypothetical protein ACLGG5_02910, partial [Thermoleophilia bacterium]